MIEDSISYNSLFVDDIFDSGKTFSDIMNQELIMLRKITCLRYTLFARQGEELLPSQLIYGKTN